MFGHVELVCSEVIFFSKVKNYPDVSLGGGERRENKPDTNIQEISSNV